MAELVSTNNDSGRPFVDKLTSSTLDWNSALFIILNGTKEEHLDMLDGGIIQRLLEEKWKTFARVRVYHSYQNHHEK